MRLSWCLATFVCRDSGGVNCGDHCVTLCLVLSVPSPCADTVQLRHKTLNPVLLHASPVVLRER